MRHFFCFLIFLAASPAWAENAMRHVVVTPKVEPEKPASPVSPAPPADTQAPPVKKTAPALSLDKIFIPYKDTKEWPELRAAMTISSLKDLERILAAVNTAPQDVPPTAFFMIATSLAEQNRMEEAARFYYMGQLRASFDTARFPARAAARPTVNMKGKVPDQVQQVPEGPVKIINPHNGIDMIARMAGTKIGPWVMADPARLKTIAQQVKEWDGATAYHYKLPYDTPFIEDEKTWGDLLTTTRTDFFTRLEQISQALKSLPTRSQPRPAFSQ